MLSVIRTFFKEHRNKVVEEAKVLVDEVCIPEELEPDIKTSMKKAMDKALRQNLMVAVRDQLILEVYPGVPGQETVDYIHAIREHPKMSREHIITAYPNAIRKNPSHPFDEDCAIIKSVNTVDLHRHIVRKALAEMEYGNE